MKMIHINPNAVPNDGTMNRGELLQANVRFAIGYPLEQCKRDSVPHTVAGDLSFEGTEVQVKAAKAWAAFGTTDLDGYIAADAASEWWYVTTDGTVYRMTAKEWKEFVLANGSIQKASDEKGNVEGWRIKSESTKMLAWLSEYVRFGKAPW